MHEAAEGMGKERQRMVTLIHSPQTRSTRILWLLEELGAPYDIRYVTISRQDGTGGPDANNPHPDKKVPALLDDGALITESIAIIQYLADKYPEAGLAPKIGDPLRGPYLTWLAYYAAVMEPVNMLGFMGVAETPALARGIGSKACVDAHISRALQANPYLLGAQFSAADLLYSNAAMWFRQLLPDGAHVDDYLARCSARPALAQSAAKDQAPV
jgi:glutathione S-transferase